MPFELINPVVDYTTTVVYHAPSGSMVTTAITQHDADPLPAPGNVIQHVLTVRRRGHLLPT